MKIKIILSIFFALIFSACGGGGMGTALRPLESPFIKANQPSQYSATSTTPQNAINDENQKITIAIVDGKFAAYNQTSTSQRLSKATQSPEFKSTQDGSLGHGAKVASIIANHNTSSTLIAYEAGMDNSNNLSLNNAIYPQLKNQNAKVFNNSHGTQATNNLDDIQRSNNEAVYKPLSEMAANQNVLFIWAAGNENGNQASDQASLPKLYPQAAKGWIAVTALQNGSFASYANKIGQRAKNWGLAANGTHNFNNQSGSGTSFAAPVVSAIAAKVWEKFPWMDNHLVVQTLLTTADAQYSSSPTTGPNTTVGWGRLNETRALKGPARFDKRLLLGQDKVVVDLSYRNYTDQNKLTFSNDIKGDAGLHKKGNGTLILSGKNHYEGQTLIENGTLKLENCGIVKSDIIIQNQGELKSSAQYSGKNINNQGKFTIENTTQIDSYKGSGKLFIALDATLRAKTVDLNQSTLIVKAKQNSITNTQIQHTLINANQNITGFSGNYQVQYDNHFITINDLSYSNLRFLITYTPNSTTSVVKSLAMDNKRTRRAAANFDELLTNLQNTPPSTPIYSTALSILNAPSQSLPSIIDTLTGEIHASANLILAKQNELLHRKISQRVHFLRALEDSGFYSGALHSRFKLNSPIFANATMNLNGMLFGMDSKINEDAMLGFAFLNAKNHSNFDKRAGQSTIKNRYFTLYGSYGWDDVYLLNALGVGFAENELTRLVHNLPTTSKHNDKFYNAYFEMGKDFWLQKAKFSVFGGFASENIYRGAFFEKAVLGFKAEGKHYHLIHSIGGLRARASYQDLELETELRHRIALNPSDFSFQASWQNGAKAQILGQRLSRHASSLNLSAIYKLSPTLRLDLGHDFSFRNFKESEAQIFSLGLRYSY